VSDFELILVDNASENVPPGWFEALVSAEGLPNIQVYRLIHSVDYDIAAWVGVENSIGDFVLVFNPFLDSLSILPAALDEAAKGRELVLIRNAAPAAQNGVERLLAEMFRKTFNWLSELDLREDAASYRLMSKRIVAYLLQQPRPALRYRTLPAAAGFSRATLTYSNPRPAGGRRSLWRRMREAMRLVLANTFAPIRIMSVTALAGAALNVLYSVYVLVIALLKPDVAPGWVTLSLQQSGMFFLLSAMIFILSEYLMHTLKWMMGGPQYFVASEMTSAVLTRHKKLNVEGRSQDTRLRA
jgi:hypothetical protein